MGARRLSLANDRVIDWLSRSALSRSDPWARHLGGVPKGSFAVRYLFGAA